MRLRPPLLFATVGNRLALYLTWGGRSNPPDTCNVGYSLESTWRSPLKAIDLEDISLRYIPNIPLPPRRNLGGRRAGAMEKLLHGENLGGLLGRCLPCPGPVCTSCFPDLGLTGPISFCISKTRALYMYLIWENVGRKGAFFFFWQLQPIKHMVTRSKTHVICMGKLPYRRIDLVNVSPPGSGKCLPDPAVLSYCRTVLPAPVFTTIYHMYVFLVHCWSHKLFKNAYGGPGIQNYILNLRFGRSGT